MSQFVQEKLVVAVSTVGRSLREDSRLCRALLADLCRNEHPAEVNILVQAVEHGLVRELAASRARWRAQARLARRLCRLGYREELAGWAVATWALALRGVPPETHRRRSWPWIPLIVALLAAGVTWQERELISSVWRRLVRTGTGRDRPPDWGMPVTDLPAVLPVLLPHGEVLELALIPAGSFMMGSPPDEPERSGNEGPVRRVTIARPFYLGTHEVTQGQWTAVMGSNPAKEYDERGTGGDYPVFNISWHDCQEFVRKLNSHIADQRSTADAAGQPIALTVAFRLPSEAEWEYACRAGTSTPFAFGRCLSTDDANYDGNYPLPGCSPGQYRRRTLPVGSLRANAFGLYDMHGNVWEWCQDWYHDSYAGAPSDGRAWEEPTGSLRVLRGGSWYYDAGFCRSANREWILPDYHHLTGLRVAAGAI